MIRRRRPAFCAVLCAAAAAMACSGASGTSATSTDYVVERAQEGGVTHARIVSGSLWDDARLVEELAVGVEAGDDPYLFGEISAAWMTDDAIYVVDAQVPAVRAYDLQGNHLHDVGRPGQGPGEYGLPYGLVVTDDRRVLVADPYGTRVNVYDETGALLQDWSLASQKSGLDLFLLADGRVLTQAWSLADQQMGLQAVGPDGPAGELLVPPPLDFHPPTLSIVPQGKGGGEQEVILPFAPSYVWTVATDGRMVAGTGDAYRFVVQDTSGERLIVERAWDPVPVAAGEGRFRAALLSASLRFVAPGVRLSGADVPAHKPAFESFYADRSARLWLIRESAGQPDADCTALDEYGGAELWVGGQAGTTVPLGAKPGDDRDPLPECWAPTWVFDLFDLRSGDFLATLPAPETGFRRPLFAHEDTVLAAVTDEDGTLRLKVYRIRKD